MAKHNLSGNTSGLKPSQLQSLERLGRRRVPPSQIVTGELAQTMATISREIGRRVGLLITRGGHIDYIAVGDASRIQMPEFGRLRAATGRFRGLRWVHTHLYDEELTRDDLVDLIRLRLDLVAAICVSPQGRAGNAYYAHLMPTQSSDKLWHTEGPIPVHALDVNFNELIRSLETEYDHKARARPIEAKEGRAILVHVATKGNAHDAEDSLAELERLADTAGVATAGKVLQVRDRVDAKYVMGRGKLEDVVLLAMDNDAELVIFDQELRPAQARAIGDLTDLRVIDRTQLILDIFAQRAQSRDGKLQVELAQLRYRLPRLGKRDDALSRLTGGIGGRGPGETTLEIGRRRTRERIARLERNIELLARHRRQKRQRRARSQIPVVAIVGYTNAGKSTLLNALTRDDSLVEDRLFATLDPRSRRRRLPGGSHIVLTDTVGFIRDLPKDLLAAFRATLEELQEAKLLVHIVDIGDRCVDDHLRTVENVLVDLDLHAIPRLLILNKADTLVPAEAAIIATRLGAIPISATEPATLAPMLAEVDRLLSGMKKNDANPAS